MPTRAQSNRSRRTNQAESVSTSNNSQQIKFEDNRPDRIAQCKLQDSINNSAQTRENAPSVAKLMSLPAQPPIQSKKSSLNNHQDKFKNNRSEAAVQRKLQDNINNSPQTWLPAIGDDASVTSASDVAVATCNHAVFPMQRARRFGASKSGGDNEDLDVKNDFAGAVDATGAYLGTGTAGPSMANALNPSALPESNVGNIGAGGGTHANVSATGGGLAVGANLYTGAMAIKGLVQSERKAKSVALQAARTNYDAGHQQLYAAVNVLEKEKQKALTGDLENIEQLGTSINGVINGVTTLLNSLSAVANTATAVISVITFGIGAGLAALLGTINGIRDSLNAHKRRKNQEATGTFIEFTQALLESYGAKIESKNNELRSAQKQYRLSTEYLFRPDEEQDPDTAVIHSTILRGATAFESGINADILALQSKMPLMVKMISGLELSKRKQGYKEKAGTASLNFLGAAGGAALLAATIGGVAAAATPIGWTLIGLATIGVLVYSVGKKVKRKIRGSNVLRMREERDMINAQVAQNPNLPDQTWHREDFETAETKGWFNKLFSRSKSGSMTIRQRLIELNTYLKKYDIEAAGDDVYNGILAALVGEEGSDAVEVSDGIEKSFKSATGELLTTLGIDPNMIIASMQGDDAAQAKAKKLLLGKMKLLPK